MSGDRVFVITCILHIVAASHSKAVSHVNNSVGADVDVRTDVTGAGFVLALTNTGFKYAANVGAYEFKALIPTLKIPDSSDTVHVPVVGSVDVDLSNVKILDGEIGANQITASPGTIQFGLGEVSIAATADWSYRMNDWPHAKDHGSLDIGIVGGALVVDSSFGFNNSEPTINIENCKGAVGGVELHFNGGTSWLYNAFKGAFAGPIEDALRTEMCTGIEQILPTVNQLLQKMGSSINLDHNVSAVYELTAAPQCTVSSLVSTHKGYFKYGNSTAPSKFSPPEISVPTDLTKMMYMWVTGFLAETAGEAYQEAGVLDFEINASAIPPSIPIQLNTSSFATMIPKLEQMYPNKAMYLRLDAKPSPVTTHISPTVLNLSLAFDSNFFVVDGMQFDLTPVFSLNTTIYVAAAVTCVSANGTAAIHFNVSLLELKLDIDKSEVGSFDPSNLASLLNFVAAAILVPQINKAGETGIPIPVLDGLTLVDPQVEFDTGYIRIGTDISYNNIPVVSLNKVGSKI